MELGWIEIIMCTKVKPLLRRSKGLFETGPSRDEEERERGGGGGEQEESGVYGCVGGSFREIVWCGYDHEQHMRNISKSY